MKLFQINTIPFADPDQVVIKTEPDEIASDAFHLSIGRRVGYSAPVSLRASPDRGDKLLGLIANTHSMLILRRDIAETMLSIVNQAHTEVIWAFLVNRSGMKTSHPYAIINPLDPVSCLDVSRSKCRTRNGRVTRLDADGIVLAKDRIPDRHLFRIAEWPSYYIASGEVMSKIKNIGALDLNIYLRDVDVA